MIYTVTFNPSLDYTVHMPVFRAGTINRVVQEAVYPGGKGINVGIILRRLGLPVRLLGFVAGFTGAEIERLSCLAGCQCDFIHLEEGLSRINVKIGAGKTVLAGEEKAAGIEAALAETGAETAVNGLGPEISDENLQLLFQQFETLGSEDILVLSGSISKGLPPDTYRKILERMNGKQVRVVVDAEGELLTSAVPCHPFLIKPNKEEMEELFKVELRTDEGGCLRRKTAAAGSAKCAGISGRRRGPSGRGGRQDISLSVTQRRPGEFGRSRRQHGGRIPGRV